MDVGSEYLLNNLFHEHKKNKSKKTRACCSDERSKRRYFITKIRSSETLQQSFGRWDGVSAYTFKKKKSLKDDYANENNVPVAWYDSEGTFVHPQSRFADVLVHL